MQSIYTQVYWIKRYTDKEKKVYQKADSPINGMYSYVDDILTFLE